uniref:(California timema) hypothetical protein n=1 Tax=Timema californicum TaxID=61474 RepID=A0A7R9PDR6_TIMCA|nr:unnamed protein product [Timema californicum]
MEDQQDEDTPKFHKTQIWPEISEDSGYKYKLSALLFIRSIQTHRKFLLASHIGKLDVECTNSEGHQGLVESFNDIIFIEESQGGVKSCSFVLVKCTVARTVTTRTPLPSLQRVLAFHRYSTTTPHLFAYCSTKDKPSSMFSKGRCRALSRNVGVL